MSIDPKLLARRVKRVRQAEAALATVKATLVTYLSENAAETCESQHAFLQCDQAVDGVLLVSCGHYSFLCADHASRALKKTREAHEASCTKPYPDLHAHPARGVTVEWQGLA